MSFPPATVRYGSFLEAGVVAMPSYVNVGGLRGRQHHDRHVGRPWEVARRSAETSTSPGAWESAESSSRCKPHPSS